MSDRPRGPGRPLGQVIRKMERKSRRHDIRFADDAFEYQQGPEGTMVEGVPGASGGVDWFLAVVQVAITARTGTASPFTLGKGAGYICTLNRTTTDLIATAGPFTSVIYNTTLSEIAIGKLIQVKNVAGYWFADVADC